MSLRSLLLLASAALLGLQLLASPASAGQRVALVIGNASYAHAPSLANPLNDATDIGASLERLGFAVTHLPNAGYSELRRGLQQFSLAASASEMAVVFYAGHGIEVDKRNFLIPVDARLLSDGDVEFEAVPLDLLSRAVERAKGLRLIILDACRDNPFAVAMQRSGATRSIGRGLASVEPSGETLVAYAAKEGTVASDGEGRNSPYTTALLAHLEEPGLEVGLMFRKVRDAVLATTGGRQEPFVYGSLSSEGAYFAALPEPEPEPAPAPVVVDIKPDRDGPTQAELLFWESVKDSENPQELQAYLDRYPEGTYTVLARSRLKNLVEPEVTPDVQVVAVAPDEPVPDPSPTPEALEAALELNRDERRRIQRGLASLGFDPGPADGLFGSKTRAALAGWQFSQGEKETGYLDAEAARLLLAVQTTVEPETSITVHTVPANARVRVITATGSTYRDGMVVQPGQYQIAVHAPHHESFRQSLAVKGPTTYRISLCEFESETQNVCKNKPITRTKSARRTIDREIEGTGTIAVTSYQIIAYNYWKTTRSEVAVRHIVREMCRPAEENAKNAIERSCKALGGRVDPGSFRVVEEDCSLNYSNKVLRIVGSMLCKDVREEVEEHYVEQVEECRDVIEEVLVCPDEIVTRVK